MNSNFKLNSELEQRAASCLMDVLIRAGLVLGLVLLCYQILSPFVSLMVWALIMAVTMYPLHQYLAKRLGDRQGLAATVLVLIAMALIVTPVAVLMNSLGESVQALVQKVQAGQIAVPPPYPGVEDWPIIGKRIHAFWQNAYADLPSAIAGMRPQIADLLKSTLNAVAGIGGGLLMFIAAFGVAGIIMSYGRGGDRASRAIFDRIVGRARGAEFVVLTTATIRAVAQGVIGVAFIQAIAIGLALLVAGVPWASALAAVMLVLGIAQVPAAIITLPAIIWIWGWSGQGTGAAIAYTLLLIVAGMVDNVLKPLMLGRGVDAPMPVILLGALGGMGTGGILGMFVGAVVLALGYQIFMHWVENNPDNTPVNPDHEPETTG